jgi:argonaute-like protein implicated in RNA metabolism and viral defense
VSNKFRKGQTVKWEWGKGSAKGKVEERFDRRVQRTLKGSKVVKNGTEENPAYLIEQDDGDKVLKRGSELSAG